MQPIVFRVKLEPALERQAGAWGPHKRIEMAQKFMRWARQLKISVAVLRADLQERPRPPLSPLHPRKLEKN